MSSYRVVRCAVAVTGLVLAQTSAQALVVLETRSGTGQVDAADIRAATGWNDTQFQERVLSATFRFQVVEQLTVICAAPPQGGLPPAEDHQMWESQINGELHTAPRLDPRTPRKLSGLLFTGIRHQTQTSPTPQLGQPCSTRLGLPGAVTAVIPKGRVQTLTIEQGGLTAPLPF